MSENQEPIRVVVAADFSDEIIESLREISPRLQIARHFPDVTDDVMAEAEVLYTIRHFPQPQAAPNLRWVQLHFAGVERTLRHTIVQQDNVTVTTGSGIHAVQMAEYCLGMMLAFMYRIPLMLEYQAKSEWPENQYDIFAPHGLRGLTLGIVGYGSIGRELARMADALGMVVLATKRDLMRTTELDGYTEPDTGDPTGEIPERIYPPEAVGSMAQVCDFLVVTVPYTDDTHAIINADVLSRMPSHAVLINVARGGVVDEQALIDALKAKQIRGAALDVFVEEPLPASSPLWKLPNVIISPHVSGNSSRYNEKAAALFAENLRRYVEQRPLLNRIDHERGY